MTDTYQNLLATVLACPEEDGPRLVLADYLEEQGDGARAEFVRVQVELARIATPGDIAPGCSCNRKWCWVCETIKPLQQRERELWGSWPDTNDLRSRFHAEMQAIRETEWTILSETYKADIGNNQPSAIVRRGFVAEVRCRLQDWMGGETLQECPACQGRGERWYLESPASVPLYRMSREEPKPFRCVLRPCIDCSGTRYVMRPTGGIGPALVRQQPVQLVRTEKRPRARAGARTYSWARPASILTDTDTDVLPYSIWKLLPGGICQGVLIIYPTEQAAQDALSAALLRWAIRQSPAPLTGVV